MNEPDSRLSGILLARIHFKGSFGIMGSGKVGFLFVKNYNYISNKKINEESRTRVRSYMRLVHAFVH